MINKSSRYVMRELLGIHFTRLKKRLSRVERVLSDQKVFSNERREFDPFCLPWNQLFQLRHFEFSSALVELKLQRNSYATVQKRVKNISVNIDTGPSVSSFKAIVAPKTLG